jgi:hypothetical protein
VLTILGLAPPPMPIMGAAQTKGMGAAPMMPAMMMPAMPMLVPVGAVDVDDEDMAFGAGFEIGNASKLVRFGLGYFRVEANGVVAQFTDSDALEGFTNREGLVFFASRKLTASSELRLTLYDAEEIRDRGGPMGPFAMSLVNADRKKAQVDLLFAF